jgi:hypothetical protein
MKQYKYLAGTVAIAIALAFSACSKEDYSTDEVARTSEQSVLGSSDNAIYGGQQGNSSAGDTNAVNYSLTGCRCPDMDTASIH